MNVRDATDDDVTTVRSLAREAWTRATEDAIPESIIDEAVADWYAEETMSAIIGDDEQVCLVAADDGEIVGFAHGATAESEEAAASGPDGDILRLFVHADRWGEGIGTDLLEATEERLTEAGAERIQAMVLADNGMGNAFYERRGFEKTDEAETRLGETTRTENVFVKVR
jgi:ribosomal protein S18 acetylase RimI-like enzyme